MEVIDHHLLEREPSATCSITVETVGSCATLVTERILQEAPHVLEQQAAQLLYGKRVRGQRSARVWYLHPLSACVCVCVCL